MSVLCTDGDGTLMEKFGLVCKWIPAIDIDAKTEFKLFYHSLGFLEPQIGDLIVSPAPIKKYKLRTYEILSEEDGVYVVKGEDFSI